MARVSANSTFTIHNSLFGKLSSLSRMGEGGENRLASSSPKRGGGLLQLLEKLEDGLRSLVGLAESARTGLDQDLVLGVVDDLGGEVRVLDRAQ